MLELWSQHSDYYNIKSLSKLFRPPPPLEHYLKQQESCKTGCISKKDLKVVIQILLCTSTCITGAVAQRCFTKRCSWKIRKIQPESLFEKSCRLEACNCFKNRQTPAQVFSCEFCGIFQTNTLYNSCKQLPLVGKHFSCLQINMI